MGALEHLRQLNRREVKLEDGLVVGYHLPDVEECLVAGDIPLPALNELPAKPTETDVAAAMDEVPAGDIGKRMLSFKKRLVAAMLEDIDGYAVDADEDRIAICAAFTPAQRDELFMIATRQKDPDSGEA